jgi:hypothetical protein
VSESSEVEVHSPVVEDWGELTPEEERELHRLELRVERAFSEGGAALKELRDKRLYRSTHANFEDYCRDRFGFSRRHPYRLIDAAIVVENLSDFCVQFGHILPLKESICRPLTVLEKEQQIQAWSEVMQETGGKQPTGQVVKGIVERLKEKPLIYATDFCSTGDVFTLIRLEGEQRKYNGCWAIALHINDFTVGVCVHDGTILVKPENLKPIDEPDVRRQLPQTLKRIRRLRNVGMLDRCTYTVLDFFGRQTYLSDLEDDLLTFFEQRHGIKD